MPNSPENNGISHSGSLDHKFVESEDAKYDKHVDAVCNQIIAAAGERNQDITSLKPGQKWVRDLIEEYQRKQQVLIYWGAVKNRLTRRLTP